MLSSLVLFAVAVSAATLPPRGWGKGVNLPDSAFPKFELVSLEAAKLGKDREKQGLSGPDSSTKQDIEIFDSTSTTEDAASCSANPSIHTEWHRSSQSDQLAFVEAVKCLLNKPASGNFPPATNRYEDLVRLHQINMPDVHNNGKFLPWHRYYLWTLEQVLRTECGFSGPMLWWDETIDAGAFAKSTIFTNTTFGTLPAPDRNGNPVCVTDGTFADLIANIGPGPNNTPHCLSRGVDEDETARCSAAYVALCNQRTDYADFETCLEYGPHAYGHDGTGGVMSDVYASPSDPIFWMHHSFVDHAWASWQGQNNVRVGSLDGVDHSGAPLTLNTVLSMGGIGPDVTVGTVIDTMSGVDIGGTPFCWRYDS